MKLKMLFSFLLIFNIIIAQKTEYQFIKKGDFPEGIYMTLEDVLNKKPSSTDEVYFETNEKYDDVNLPGKAFFYLKKNNRKVKFPLAVSFKGEMYFQTYRKYTNKKDKGYDPDAYSRFCKVTNYGRFIYFEESMRGMFSKFALGAVSPVTYVSLPKNWTNYNPTINDKKQLILGYENK